MKNKKYNYGHLAIWIFISLIIIIYGFIFYVVISKLSSPLILLEKEIIKSQDITDKNCKEAFNEIRFSFMPEDKNLDRDLIEKMSNNGLTEHFVFEKSYVYEDEWTYNGKHLMLYSISPEYFMSYWCDGYNTGMSKHI